MPSPIAASSNLAFDERPRGAGNTGATEQIARTLRESGIDAPTGLYDEALSLARDGHLSPAAERLRMLLCLDPTDAEAALFLGKVLMQRGQFQEALANLDAAATHGAVLPAGLRDEVEAGLKKQIREAEEHRARVATRERGEVQQLRQEAKKLRSENAALELEVDELQRRVRMWSSGTALTAGVAGALLLAVVLFTGGSDGDAADLSADSALATEVLTPTPSTVSATAGSTVPQGDVVKGDLAQAPTTTARTASVAPAATAPAAAAPAAGSSKTYTVRSGDTLGKIANRFYGKSSQWPRIQDANKAKLGPDGIALQPGMKLVIPPAE